MRKYFLIILLLLFSFCSEAQKKNTQQRIGGKDTSSHASMHIIAKNYGDSIVVRWAPGSAVVWLLSQKNGFVVKRMVLSKNRKNVYSMVDSSSIIIHPWTLDEWANAYKTTNDSMMAMAAQLLYGKTLAFNNDKQGNSITTIVDKYNEQQNRFGFALMIADFNPNVAKGLGFRLVDKKIRKDLYYLYAVYPAQQLKQIIVDTGRVLINASQKETVEKFSAVTVVRGDKVIHLFWKANAQKHSYSGYLIERSEDGKIFTQLNKLPYVSFENEKGQLKPVHYIDSVFKNYKIFYYRVSGVNAFGDHSQPSEIIAAKAVDLTAPEAPVITEIKAQGEGKIHFKWQKDFQEPDFKGYVVGRSANMKGPFEPLNKELLPFSVNEFTDEHPSAMAPNYYMVVAVDTAGNAGRSLPAYMNVEDHTPPAQPVGLSGNIDSSGRVTVKWNWGKEEDLAGYKIFYANAPDHQFTPLTTELLTDTVYTDSINIKTLTKKIYYKVIAYDRSMNASLFSQMLTLNKPDVVAPMPAIIYSFNVTDSGVLLHWYPGVSTDVATQELFREKDSTRTWEKIAKLNARDSLYTDRSAEGGHVYRYSIQTIDSSGLSSERSFPLQVYKYNKGYNGSIQNFEATEEGANNNKTITLKWTPPSNDVDYYILYKEKDHSGFRIAGSIDGNANNFKESVSGGSYRYAIKAVYKNGNESAISQTQPILVQQ